MPAHYSHCVALLGIQRNNHAVLLTHTGIAAYIRGTVCECLNVSYLLSSGRTVSPAFASRGRVPRGCSHVPGHRSGAEQKRSIFRRLSRFRHSCASPCGTLASLEPTPCIVWLNVALSFFSLSAASAAASASAAAASSSRRAVFLAASASAAAAAAAAASFFLRSSSGASRAFSSAIQLLAAFARASSFAARAASAAAASCAALSLAACARNRRVRAKGSTRTGRAGGHGAAGAAG